MTAKRGMFEESRDEFVVFHLADVLLLQGPFPRPESAAAGHHLTAPGAVGPVAAAVVHRRHADIHWRHVLASYGSLAHSLIH